jgi:replication factor C subunit 2/4
VIEQESLSNQQKVQIIEAIAKADRCLIDGADEFLQVFSVMSVMMRVMTAS